VDSKITELFYRIDESFKEFERNREEHIHDEKNAVKRRRRKIIVSDSERITIAILFSSEELSVFKTFLHHARSELDVI
tara:strand:+ start:182 stop:415 length:234 start_codon:yes stop_codon:yes gene_type:complete